jgi:glycyl-tRNA synthetase beta chain
MTERLIFVLESRGFDVRTARAVTGSRFTDIRPADELQKLKVLPDFIPTGDFQALAIAFKRAKNITKDLDFALRSVPQASDNFSTLIEPAEKELVDEIQRRRPVIERAADEGKGFREAFAEAAQLKPAIDRFFDDVLVMAPDAALRQKRQLLLWRFVELVLKLADISEIVVEQAKQT